MPSAPAETVPSRLIWSVRRNGGFVLLTSAMLIRHIVAPSSFPLWYRVTMAMATAWIGLSAVESVGLPRRRAVAAGTAFIIGSAGWIPMSRGLAGLGLLIYVMTFLSIWALGFISG